MRRRPSARLLVLDPAGKILLFRFAFKKGALAGQGHWGTPGGAIEPGETFAQAAVRELEEETGIQVKNIGAPVAQREFILQLVDGEQVVADEQYFLVETKGEPLSRGGWTAQEMEVMTEHRWWTQAELARTSGNGLAGESPGDTRGRLVPSGRPSFVFKFQPARLVRINRRIIQIRTFR